MRRLLAFAPALLLAPPLAAAEPEGPFGPLL
jgi:hypothetical protein